MKAISERKGYTTRIVYDRGSATFVQTTEAHPFLSDIAVPCVGAAPDTADMASVAVKGSGAPVRPLLKATRAPDTAPRAAIAAE